MIRRALLAGLWLGLAACNQGSSGPSFRLEQPSAVTVFRGFTARHAELWPYAAVANTAQDELVMLDAVEDAVVAAPILLRPLSIPLPNPRPALLASARFTPPEGGPDRPDLLVAVSAGSTELQLIRTWKDAGAATGPGLAEEAPIDLGGQILALIATPAVGSDGKDVADRVRVVAALADDRIAVVEYVWTGDPAPGHAARDTGPVYQDVGFAGLSLAVDPKDHSFLYAATLEMIGSVFGVAQIDMTRSVGSWPVEGIDAKAPTRLVAAFTLRERKTTAAGAYDQSTAPAVGQGDTSAFNDAAVPRVYALRDPGACGPRTPVACGVAVLDPATHDVLEDPWHPGLTPKRYLPPIAVPSTPVALVVGQPAKNPPTGATSGLESSELMLIDPITPRLTTGVLLMPSEDGRSYFADLARWEVPSSTREIQSSVSGVGVSSFTPSNALLPRIGFFVPQYLGARQPEFGTSAAFYVQLTPGFTPNDQWTITFQGYLPDFAASRAATVELLSGTSASTTPNTFLVSLQTTRPGASAPTQVVNVYDPAFGLHVGDIVEFWTDGSTTSDTPKCPDTTLDPEAAIPPIEGKITEIRAPDAGHPGGSLVVVRGDCVPWAKGITTSCEQDRRGPWLEIDPTDCWNLLPNAGTVAPVPQGGRPHLGAPRQLRIRAGSGAGAPGSEEFVVVGAATGYAGRAVSSSTDPGNVNKPTYALQNDGEAALAAGCQLIPYPAPGAAVPACDATCRATCERASLAVRARRLHLTSVGCPASTTGTLSYCETYFPGFKLPDANTTFEPPVGPALAFSLERELVDGKDLVRDTHVSFTTRSGWTPASRWGGGGNSGPATQPTGGVWFDRTEDPAWNRANDRYRFFVPYVGNLVLDLSPAQGNDTTRVLR